MSGNLTTSSPANGANGAGVKTFEKEMKDQRRQIQRDIIVANREVDRLQAEVDDLGAQGKEKEARLAYAQLKNCQQSVSKMQEGIRQMQILANELKSAQRQMQTSKLHKLASDAYASINSGVPEAAMKGYAKRLETTRAATTQRVRNIDELNNSLTDSILAEDGESSAPDGSGFDDYMQMKFEQAEQQEKMEAALASSSSSTTATAKKKLTKDEEYEEEIRRLVGQLNQA